MASIKDKPEWLNMKHVAPIIYGKERIETPMTSSTRKEKQLKVVTYYHPG
jgi:hypothetical protein